MPKTSSSRIFFLIVSIYCKLHALFVDLDIQKAAARFAVSSLIVESVLVQIWRVFKVVPTREVLRFIGRRLYWIFIRDEVGFYQGPLSFNRLWFGTLGWMFGSALGLIVMLAELTSLSSNQNAPAWFNAMSGAFALLCPTPYIAPLMPFVGVIIMAIWSIKLPPVKWLALLGPRNPPRPPRGREPIPSEEVARMEEPLRQAA